MKSLTYIKLIILMLFSIQGQAQNAKGEDGIFALTNATIYTVTNGVVENGTLIIENGKVAALGNNVSVPGDAKVINCEGLSIYPGMIDGGTRLGLMEVGSDARTRDYNEIGEVIPHMQALTAVNPNSVLIPVTRVNGVTSSLAVPDGSLFPGTAALINLHGYTPDQMYAGFDAVVLNFPNTGRSSAWDTRSDEDIKKEADNALKKLEEVWDKASAYTKIDSTLKANKSETKMEYYPEMEAIKAVINGDKHLLVDVNRADDIKKAIEWVADKDVKVIFTGVLEGWRVADELAEAKIPVITGPVLSVPTRDYDRYDRPYKNAGIMHKAGVKVALKTTDAENVRNLPYNAGFAATYGLGKEQALKAVTIIPAEIFGVADQLGSLEEGKQANLFVTDGDPFETKTQVKYLFIQGWKIPLESRHTLLYDEFLEREPGLKK